MFVVDANVLIYASNERAPESAACLSRLQAWANDSEPWFLTWGIVYEFLRVVTHWRLERPLASQEAWAFLNDVLGAPSLRILHPTDRHFAVLRDVLSEVPDLAGNLFFDVRTAVLMREHGIRRIVTRDRDFERFPFVEVIDPLN